MGRKKNKDDAMGGVPVCPNGHGALQRRVADSPFECDMPGCQADIILGICFFGCLHCDYSLCGTCYVSQATAVAEANQEAEERAEKLAEDDGRIHPHVWDICEQFTVEDRIMVRLNEAMKKRHDTWEEDFARLWMELKSARSPAGLLFTKVKEMESGTFIGKKPPPPNVKRVIDKYKVDGDAREKMTDFLTKVKVGEKVDEYLWEIERRLETSGKPSATVMTMIVKLQRGEPLPPIRAPKGGGKGRDRDRDRDRRDDRDRDRDRDRREDRDRDRDKDRGRDQDRSDRNESNGPHAVGQNSSASSSYQWTSDASAGFVSDCGVGQWVDTSGGSNGRHRSRSRGR